MAMASDLVSRMRKFSVILRGPERPPVWPAKPRLICWLLDTRNLWPGNKIDEAAGEYLELISSTERANVRSKVFMRDAKLALGSALLKRLFIRKILGVPWTSISFHRRGDPMHGKPCYIHRDDPSIVVEFNVSHQHGLVALVGSLGADIELGVDIVSVNERDDFRIINSEGFDGWVDMFDEIFGVEDRWDMKYNVDRFQLLDGTVITGAQLGRADRCCVTDKELITQAVGPDGSPWRFNSDLLIDAKLRRFYTFWCYKEAYIKLSGEALLAPWLRQLEFRNVVSPLPGTVARCSTDGVWGERLTDVEVLLHGETQEHVRMEIQAFEENYMIACAINTSRIGAEFPPFEVIDIERELLQYASWGMDA
ncbi:MAG: hypothetical protein M1822_006153 [Bathelium mastoideum]|nr:MAG: hypothetical protein M1822_006153 [Bathelium mastoideum]